MLFLSIPFVRKVRAEKTSSAEKRWFFSLRKPVCVVHPENAPRMIRDSGFPKDFADYAYLGATLEVLSIPNANGEVVRRPVLVAKLGRTYKDDIDGVSAEMEMTATLSDLRHGKHPHTDSIAAALISYYEEKIPIKEASRTGLRKPSLVPLSPSKASS